MPSPKTATLRFEIVNDDGSKTIVTTAELDASKLPALGAREDSPERIIIGMVDPHHDPYGFDQRRDWWINETVAINIPRKTHFNLNLQLPPTDPNKPVYAIEEIEAPDTQVIVVVHPGDTMRVVTSHTEKGIQRLAEHSESIFFFLNIPN